MTLHAVEEIRRLPGTWQSSDHRRLLSLLEVDDLESYEEADLESVSVMALQDAGLDQAPTLILSNFTDGRLNPGQVRNLRHELEEERFWEEYADLTLQRELYLCVDLLSLAFPRDYPEPSATQVQMSLRAGNLDKMLSRHSLDAATLLRSVRQAMDASSVLNRFFTEQLAGGPFPEATSVVWGMEAASSEPNHWQVVFWGSGYWFKDLEEGEFSATLLLPED